MARPGQAIPETLRRRAPSATPRRSTAPSPARHLRRRRPRRTVPRATLRTRPAPGPLRRHARAGLASPRDRWHPASYRACAACAGLPRRQAPPAARRTHRGDATAVRRCSRLTHLETEGRAPETAPPLGDPGLERVPGTLGPPVTAFQGGDVQRHGGEILEQHRPRRQGAHGGVGLEIALAAVADLHLPRRLTLLRRQIPELLM